MRTAELPGRGEWKDGRLTIGFVWTEVRTADDLIGPGAKPGTVPTDLEQATGLERLEILGKMEGVDVFNMRPLDASRKGKPGPPA